MARRLFRRGEGVPRTNDCLPDIAPVLFDGGDRATIGLANIVAGDGFRRHQVGKPLCGSLADGNGYASAIPALLIGLRRIGPVAQQER